MKVALVIVLVCLNLYCILCIPNLIGTDFHECIKCVCHARSGCWSRINCAKYSISYSYWEEAGSPTGNYKECMTEENCILNTIKGYTDLMSRDCNCDGFVNCADILAMHLMGGRCSGHIDHNRLSRYNSCSRSHNQPVYSQGNCAEPDAE